MFQALKLVHPDQAPPVRIEIEVCLEGSLLTARFLVESLVPSHVNPLLPLGSSQWGLWEWDVVELFVACTGSEEHTPYHEFEVSPLGQHLELEIFEPRKRFNRDFRSGLECSARKLGQGSWEALMRLPLEKLGWNGDPGDIHGNAFAILGAPPERTYWSLFLGRQEKPDFHIPTKFRPLLPDEGRAS